MFRVMIGPMGKGLQAKAVSEMILILEDDADRIARFNGVLKEICPGIPIRFWRSAPRMVREIGDCLSGACLISLDHDLEPEPGSREDPGEGVEVTRHLATIRSTCPVIVHTSNTDRGRVMMSDLLEGGWKARRVTPIGADWIETSWKRGVEFLLKPGL